MLKNICLCAAGQSVAPESKYPSVSKEQARPDETLIVTEQVGIAKEYRAQGYAVLFCTKDPQNAPCLAELPYIAEELSECGDEYLKTAFCRMTGQPLHIMDTARTVIREISVADLPDLYTLYDDEEIRRYVEPLYEYEEEKTYLENYIATVYGYYGYGLWAVSDKGTGKLIGRAGISNREIDGKTRLEMGYLIRKEYRRQGYAYEVCQAIMDYCRQHKMEDPVIVIDPANLPSRELAAKLGYSSPAKINGCEYMIFQHKE